MTRERRFHESSLIKRSLSPLIAVQLALMTVGAGGCFAADTEDGALRSSGLPLPTVSEEQVQQLLVIGAPQKRVADAAVTADQIIAPEAPGWNDSNASVQPKAAFAPIVVGETATLKPPIDLSAAAPESITKATVSVSATTPVTTDGAATATAATAAAQAPATPAGTEAPSTTVAASAPATTVAANAPATTVAANAPATTVLNATPITAASTSSLKEQPILAFAVPNVQIGDLQTEATKGDGPIVVDNDEAQQVEETIKYEELATDEGKTRVKTGAKFPVVICSEINTKSAKKGDPVEARLKFDLKIGDRIVAKKGAVVTGHITYALKARSTMHSLISTERWYKNSGCLGIMFDEIINEQGEHLPLVAAPAKQALYVKNKAEGRVLGINHRGEVAGPWSQQLKYKAVRIGLNAAMAPVGVFSFGAMPAALGVMGAINPSFAFMKPVGTNVRHRRIKGFFWGALSGVPGSWLIEDTVVKGNEAIIKPGDEFLAEFKQEFTGEPATEASLMPGSSAKVHGQVMPEKKGKK